MTSRSTGTQQLHAPFYDAAPMRRIFSDILQIHISRNVWLFAIALLSVWWIFSYLYAEQNFFEKFSLSVTEAEQESAILASDLADSISRNLHYIRGISDALSQNDKIRRVLEKYSDAVPAGISLDSRRVFLEKQPMLNEMSQYLAETAVHLNVDSIYILNAHGESTATANWKKKGTSAGINFSERDYFQSNLKGLHGFQFAVGKSTRTAGLYFSSPVYSGRRFIGAVVTKVDVPKLTYLTRQIDSYVTDLLGVIILSHDKFREMHRMPDASVMSLPEKSRLDRYRVADFPLLAENPWHDSRFPQLRRDSKSAIPFVISHVTLPEYALRTYVEKQVTDYENLLNEKRLLFFTLSIGGGMTILLALGMMIYLKSKQHTERMLKFHRDNLQQQVNEQTASLMQAKLTAESASRAKSNFLSTMSHEIRTPINAMLGMTHLALKTKLDETQRSYLEKSLQSGRHLLRIVNDVLDFSKIEEGKLEIDATEFLLSESIRHTIELNIESARHKDLSLDFKIEDTVPQSFIGDSLRIEQVLINLVSNAIKFTDQGGIFLHVSQKTSDSSNTCLVRFEIRDTGIGIDGAALNALFQPFQQVDSTITRRFGGTGLGLSICKRLVDLMGGTIGVSSTHGSGSTFWFELPLATASMPVKEPRPITSTKSLQGMNVLLAEDNDFNQQVISEILEQENIRVTVANDGQEALELLEHNTFDLVLMDMQMPGMDGLAATRVIRKQPHLATLPVIALTANASAEDRNQCLAAGMTDFLSKPIEPEALFNMILKHLRDC